MSIQSRVLLRKSSDFPAIAPHHAFEIHAPEQEQQELQMCSTCRTDPIPIPTPACPCGEKHSYSHQECERRRFESTTWNMYHRISTSKLPSVPHLLSPTELDLQDRRKHYVTTKPLAFKRPAKLSIALSRKSVSAMAEMLDADDSVFKLSPLALSNDKDVDEDVKGGETTPHPNKKNAG